MCAPVLCEFFAGMGLLSLFQWAKKIGVPWDTQTCTYTTKRGHLDVLKWARANSTHQNKYTCARAVKEAILRY